MERVDSRTGEIIPMKEREVIVFPKKYNKIGDVAGPNPKGYNLRDHPELDGSDFVAVEVRFREGEYEGKTYVITNGFLIRPGVSDKDAEKATLITGADNVVNRLSEAVANDGLPCRGTLRSGGQAWFLD
jgi:hypothetical protein